MRLACLASACVLALAAAAGASSQTTSPPRPDTGLPPAPPEKVAPPGNALPKPDNGFGEMRVRNLVGARVYNKDGVRIGTVDDVVVSKASDVLAAVISGGAAAATGGRATVPISQLEWRGDRVVASGFSRDILETLPPHDDSEWRKADPDRRLGG